VTAANAPAMAATDETGRLGVLHLKRYWSKILRAQAGLSAPIEDAADNTLLCGVNAGFHEIAEFLMTGPTFDELEAWILQINGGALNTARVSRINAALSGTLDPGVAPDPGILSAEDLAHWDRDGYVVLHDAATPTQCDAAAQTIYTFIGADPADPATWYANPRGHSIWVALLRHPAFQAIRESPRIHTAFAQLWNRNDLWVSIDQGGFNPPERPGWQFPGPRLHWDVSIAQPVPLGMQGILYLTDTAANQGAFTCIPGFHRRLASWLEELPPAADPRSHEILDELPAIPIPGRAGDLIIWHQGLPHGSSPNRSTRPRVAQYIKMAPSQFDVNPVWR
jgi:hypothetical protein